MNRIEHGVIDAIHRKCQHVVLKHDFCGPEAPLAGDDHDVAILIIEADEDRLDDALVLDGLD